MSGAARLVQPLPQGFSGTLAGELGRLRALLAAAGARDGAALPPPAPRWPPLAGLAQRLGLDPFATDLVLLLLAAELEPDLAPLHATETARPWPSLALARRLFGASPEEARASLLDDAPLVRCRVVLVDEPGPLPLRALRLEPVVLGWLLGRFQNDPRLRPALVELPPPLLDAPLAATAERLAARLRVAEQAPRLRLTGPPRSGRRAVASRVAADLGLRLVALEPATLLALGEPEAVLLASLGRDAALLDLAYLIDAAALDPGDRPAAGFCQRLGRGLEALLVTVDLPGTPGSAEAATAELPDPGLGRRLQLWRAALPEAHAVAGEALAQLACEIELGPAEIVPVVRAATAEAEATGRPLAAPGLRLAARAQAAARLDGLAERLAPAAGWDDLVLPDDTLAQLREVAAAARGRATVMGEWGMAAGPRGRGVAALFSGPSGTGKTTAAELLAGELDLDLWRIDLASTVSKWVGETEKHLKRIFEAADNGGAVLFFDEADALFGKRSEVKDAHDRYANIEIDDLLQRLERHRGLAILATNRRNDLDPAFLRRLRYVVPFPFPDPAARRLIWARSFPPTAPVEPLDLDRLATLELSGGGIRNVALNAASLAAAEGAPIGMRHLWHAAGREYAKLEKLPLAPWAREPGP